MCGITGFVGDFSVPTLRAMSAAVAHRGPDDAGEFWDQETAVGLAHRRLSIIDLSAAGHQPMWDVTRTVVIVFNGEIYNYRELRKLLETEGYQFASATDTEVILNLYLRDGIGFLAKLNGIFAFALWDTRCRKLLIARDALGVKPLYYTQTPAGFLFASELKALLRVSAADKTIDADAVSHYVTFLYAPAPRTMFRSMRKLLPGYAMLINAQGIEKEWRFYTLPYDQPLEDLPLDTAVEGLREHLAQAVRRQMVADVPIGSFLSGGLDSSSVAAFARKFAHGERLQCFTIGFKGKGWEEEGMPADLPYAQKAAKHLDVDLNTVWVGPEMVQSLDRMLYHLDEPQADPAALNVLFICQLARQHGIKVLLSGAGGDDILTGYRRHHALQLERFWGWLPGYTRKALRELTSHFPGRSVWGRRFSKAFRYANRNGDYRIASYFLWLEPELMQGLYGPALRDELQGKDPMLPLLEALRELPRSTPPLNRMLYLDGKFFLTDHNLNYTDKMSMASGVEVRVPLLDTDLVAFAARLPVRYKQRGAEGKWIFKRAMKTLLPRENIYRRKTGFGAPIRNWLRHELSPLVEDTLSEQSLRARGLFDPKAVSRLVRLDRSGRVDAAYPIFALVCIELWLRRFLDGSVARSTQQDVLQGV